MKTEGRNAVSELLKTEKTVEKSRISKKGKKNSEIRKKVFSARAKAVDIFFHNGYNNILYHYAYAVVICGFGNSLPAAIRLLSLIL